MFSCRTQLLVSTNSVKLLYILLLNVNHGSKSLSNTAVYHSLILLYINVLLLLKYRGSINNVEARQDVVLDLIVLYIMKLTRTL